MPPNDPPAPNTLPAPLLTLVLGGVRSGKSVFAESLCECFDERIYLATAENIDAEMNARIEQHRARRGAAWITKDSPIGLPAAVLANATPRRVLLVDCLGVWVGNLMHHGRDVPPAILALTSAVRARRGPVVLVSSEVGLGIVPDNAMARVYCDHAGRLNQAIAAAADRVVLVTAGIPAVIKGTLDD